MNKKDIDRLNDMIEKADQIKDDWERSIHYREGLGRIIEQFNWEQEND